MLHCWQSSPDDRPSFEELHVTLQEILHQKEVSLSTLTGPEGEACLLLTPRPRWTKLPSNDFNP